MVKRKILSLVLAFCMAFMLIPTTAFAAVETVSTLTDLQTAVTNATGTEESPTVIAISGQIEVKQTIKIPAGKYIKLVGQNSNDGLIRADSFTSVSGSVTNISHLLSVQGGLVLENITVDGNNKSGGGLVFVYGNNAFTVMNEGTTLKNNLNGAVKLYSQNSTQGNPCRFIMNGGTICNNSSMSGAGVAVTNYGYADFTMNGGVIKENTATSTGGGGAIYSCANGTVTISNGKIINNKSTGSDGGAMNVTGGSELVITGGEISGNQITTSKRGGGIYKSGNADFTITGGVVQNNSTIRNDRAGQDIYIASGDFNLGGTAQIPDGLFIERYNNSSDKVNFYIVSSLQHDIEIEGLWTRPGEGRVVAEGKDYTITQNDFEKLSYNYASLVLKFDKDNNQIVLGKPSYTVTYTLSDMTFNGPEDIEKGNSLTTTLNSSDGYHSPSSITVKINGVELDKMNYQAVPVKGGIGVYIPAEYLTGNVEILAEGEAHTGGTADCQHKAVCTVCNQEYGELGIHNLTEHHYNAPTCTETGNEAYWECSVCHTLFSDAEGNTTTTIEEVTIEAPGHNWGEPVYTWSEDGKACSATLTCTKDSNHTETARATVTGTQTKAPTCTEKGETTYTAAFDVNWANQQTKTVADIAATDHDWNSPTYEWSEDGKTCTAFRTCKNDSAHNDTARAMVTSTQTKEPTCTEKGETTYTAAFAKDWAVTQTTIRTDIPIAGHSYVHHEAVSAECEKSGMEEHYTCKNCNLIFDKDKNVTTPDDLTINATGHTFSAEWKTDGEKHWHECYCGAKTEESNHTFEWITDKEAQVGTAGSKHEECTECGYKKAAVEISALKAPEYPTVIDGSDGGKVTVNPENPQAGDEVTITPKPDEGKQVDKVIVTDENGNPVEVTDNDDGTYTFVQPDGKVTVKVTFKTEESKPSTDEKSPQTGDNSNLWLWFALLFVSCGGVIGTTVYSKIKKQQAE